MTNKTENYSIHISLIFFFKTKKNKTSVSTICLQIKKKNETGNLERTLFRQNKMNL